MKRLLRLLLFLSLPSLVLAQGVYTSFPVQTPVGFAIAGATVSLCAAKPTTVTPCGGTSLQQTYSDITLGTACTLNPTVLGPTFGAGCTNPGSSDGTGMVRLYVNGTLGTPTGFFYYQTYGQGILVPDVEPIMFSVRGVGPTLKTNGTLNGSQSLLNLAQGTALTVTDNGSGTDTFALANTAVTPGSYTLSSFTVDQQGRITAASSGSAYTLPSQYGKLRQQPGLGDGLDVIPAGTYLQSTFYNDSGVNWTIIGIRCYTDNSGTSTLNAAGNTLGALLTGAITCGPSWVTGTQSANVILTPGDYVKFTFVSDGATKQTTFDILATQ